MSEQVILVDKNDSQIGTGEKMAVHRAGKLHRCFTIFVFSSEGKLLLQQRATSKYHSGGLWTNTCCGHPRPEEATAKAAHRRLEEEMGFNCKLDEKFTFIYRAELDHDLTEHEFDHVFFGTFNGAPVRNPEEAMAWKYADMDWLKEDVRENPHNYTVWFRIALPKVIEHLKK